MIKQYFEDLIKTIETLDREPLGKLIEALGVLQRNKGRLFILGVGGSAANASHAVNDFRKIAGIEAYAPTDNVAELTARTNDEGFHTIFDEWLQVSKLGKKDMVLIFSVGGGDDKRNISKNLVNALIYAKSVGAKTAGIVGRDGGETKKMADICILIPTMNEYLITPFVETMQAAIWHCIVNIPHLNQSQSKWESLKK